MLRTSCKVGNPLNAHDAEKGPHQERREKNRGRGCDVRGFLQARDDAHSGKLPECDAPKRQKRSEGAARRKLEQKIFENLDHVRAEFLAKLTGIENEEPRIKKAAEADKVRHGITPWCA